MRPLKILPGLKVAEVASTESSGVPNPVAQGSVFARPVTSLATALGILATFCLM